MDNIQVREVTPGAKEANWVMGKLRQLGIYDVQLFYDNTVLPNGLWAVVQVQKPVSSLVMLPKYDVQVQPYILYLIKTNDGHFRLPGERDVSDITAIVNNARKQWETDPTGDKMADRLDAQSAEKDRKHREKFKEKIHEIAPSMKRAIKREML